MITSNLYRDGSYWVETELNSSTLTHYNKLGYEIHHDKDKRGRFHVPRGTKINVRIDDLPKGSSVKLTKVCDYCGESLKTKQRYVIIIGSRKNGKDKCAKCALISPYEKSLKVLFPEIAEQLISEGVDTSKVFSASNKRFFWKCDNKNCNHIWESKVSNRTVLNRGCPSCSKSKGEKLIKDHLAGMDINFNWDKTHKELRGVEGFPLRFDFEVLNKSKELKCLIEYDGIQHFEATDFTGQGKTRAEYKFGLTKKYDRMKNEWAARNKIPLLRVKYDTPFSDIPLLINRFIKEVV